MFADEHRGIRRLIWLYFWLLIFEGALRKWVAPGLSSLLLVARDPVVLAIFALAIRQRVFPLNRTSGILALLFVGSLAAGLFATNSSVAVTAFGLRANYLHLPLLFVMGAVLTRGDVERFGKAVVVLAIPMAVLMVLQFRAAPDAFINGVAGAGEGEQLRGAMGKIRPPGFFSFITGAAQFLGLASAFVFHGLLHRGFVPKPLLYGAAFAIVVSLAVSTSRLALGSVALVALSLAALSVINRSLLPRVAGALAVLVALVVAASAFSQFQQGVEVFGVRAEETGDGELGVAGASQGLAMRWFSDIGSAFDLLATTPFFGWGIGLGTNAGAQFTTGSMGFLLAEGEWPRVILEIGPLLGGGYLALRVALAVWLVLLGTRAARLGEPLPLLLAGACAMLLINGQFGQPTTLGFAVFVAGLCLASLNPAPPREEDEEESLEESGFIAPPAFSSAQGERMEW